VLITVNVTLAISINFLLKGAYRMRIFTFGKFGRSLLLSAALVVGAFCVSYGDNPAAFVGQWVDVDDVYHTAEFFKDGTGSKRGRCVGCSLNMRWKTDGKRFVQSVGNSSRIGDYNLSGYELTLTFEDGDVEVWVRKDKLEEYKNKKRKEAEQRFENISSYFTDSRNGQKYRAVKIGGKTWMAHNLNYQTGKSWCNGNDKSNCDKYGRLYDWNTAKTACPAGWHLPSRKEWNGLVTAAGGEDIAGEKLNANGTDDFGFSALPGGGFAVLGGDFDDGGFTDVGMGGYWWTATEGGSGFAYYYQAIVYENEYGSKHAGMSVRCVKND
jgi:uncharacterized protein (TIGR02145 family)